MFNRENAFDVDSAEVRRQEHAKRMIEIAAAGGQNLINKHYQSVETADIIPALGGWRAGLPFSLYTEFSFRQSKTLQIRNSNHPATDKPLRLGSPFRRGYCGGGGGGGPAGGGGTFAGLEV